MKCSPLVRASPTKRAGFPPCKHPITLFLKPELIIGLLILEFQGAKIWNSLNENIKLLSVSQFKKKLKIDILEKYQLSQMQLLVIDQLYY